MQIMTYTKKNNITQKDTSDTVKKTDKHKLTENGTYRKQREQIPEPQRKRPRVYRKWDH